MDAVEQPPLLSRPVLIIGVHRSGTSLLYTLLSAAPGVFSLRAESRLIWLAHPDYHPSARGWHSEVLTASDATPEVTRQFAREFYNLALPNRSSFGHYRPRGASIGPAEFVERFTAYLNERSLTYRPLTEATLHRDEALENALKEIRAAHRPLRLIEKTPRHCLRVGFLNAIFPDALFIYIKRDGRENVSSLMEAWRLDAAQYTREAFGYDLPLPLRIPGLPIKRWRFVLPPGWQDYVDRPLEDIATFQWLEGNRIAMDDLAGIDPARVYTVCHEDLVHHTEEQMRALCAFIGVPFGRGLQNLVTDPPVISAITPPEPGKWRRQNHEAIERMLPRMMPMMRRMGYTDAT
jgi:hypothetical protein